MKRFKILILLSFLIVSGSRLDSSQAYCNRIALVATPDSCLYYLPHRFSSKWDNPDSLLWDTCSDSKDLYTRIVHVFFQVKAISLPWAPDSALVETTWEAIDTSFPLIRQTFQQIANARGQYQLRKEYPDDTSSPLSQGFTMRFQVYQNVDSVLADLSVLEEVHNWVASPRFFDDKILKAEEAENLEIFPNPAIGLLHVRFQANSASRIQLLDSRGRAVLENGITAGQSYSSLPLNGLAAGTYILKVGSEFRKFQILK